MCELVNVSFTRRDSLNAIHHWHHQVADNEIYRLIVQYFKSFRTIGSFEHIVVVAEDGADISSHICIVFNDQNGQSYFFFR